MSSFYNLLNKRLEQDRKEKMTKRNKITENDITNAITDEFDMHQLKGREYVLLEAAVKITLKLLGRLDDEN